jgi:hypothetical protein
MNQRSFGRKTEKAEDLGQLTIYDYLNEPEALCDDSREPEITEVIVSGHTRKKKTRREDNRKSSTVSTYLH